jgi:hypothetical protein
MAEADLEASGFGIQNNLSHDFIFASIASLAS